MLHVQEVGFSSSLSSILVATARLGTGKDVEDRSSGAAEVFSDLDGAGVDDLDFFDDTAMVRCCS